VGTGLTLFRVADGFSQLRLVVSFDNRGSTRIPCGSSGAGTKKQAISGGSSPPPSLLSINNTDRAEIFSFICVTKIGLDGR
jgi:hypothetical protein